VTWLPYMILWLVVMMAVPVRKHQKGIAWTFLRKIPPWRLIRGMEPFQCFVRFMLLVYSIVWWLPTEAVFSVYILLEMDDYLNGDDDDRKRRWEGVKNKVKWLMELPAPAKEARDVA
jgi:hypothetical protein